MKKPFTRALTIALILACILGFIGYQKANEIHNEDPTTPTGHPSGELQQPQIMYDGPGHWILLLDVCFSHSVSFCL